MLAFKLAQESNQEAQKRIATVSKQYQLEISLVEKAKNKASHGIKALFFVPAALTPLFINPDTITVDKDGYHVFKEGHREPDGLVPEKNRARELLSTVLSRSKSLELMLENGIEVSVMRHSVDRPKADNLPGFVADAELKRISAKYPTLLKFVEISKEDYEANKELPAAVYTDGEDFDAVYSSQMPSPVDPRKAWGIDGDNTDFIDPTRTVCEKYNVEFPIKSYNPVLDLRRMFGNN
jgi:hypothetical protein